MRIFEIYKSAKYKFETKELIKFCENLSESEFIFNLNKDFKNFLYFKRLYDDFLDGTPLEYITHKAYFGDLEFFVDKRVLIPRYESEILVKKTIKLAKNFTKPKILDLCTGSGIIAISIKKKLPNALVFASDISSDAISVAKINAKKHNANLSFINSNLFEQIDLNFDIIVSNPPYIKNSYPLDKWVLNEPKIALFGGENGDEIIKKIIKEAKNRCKFLCVEMGYDQKKSLKKFLDENGFRSHFFKDLAKLDRGFIAKNEN